MPVFVRYERNVRSVQQGETPVILRQSAVAPSIYSQGLNHKNALASIAAVMGFAFRDPVLARALQKNPVILP